jgi:CxxC motif-containing protein (DUF1111 family)
LFFREWMPDDPRSHGGDGLGPVFNDSSCVACHNLGGAGGGGPNSKNVDIVSLGEGNARRARRGTEDGTSDAAQARLHPGFRTADSVVLHRFGTAPEYVGWRLERLGMGDGPAGSREVQNALNGPPADLAKLELEQSGRSPATSFGQDLARRRVMRSASWSGLIHSQRNPTALFGAGAIDAIPDQVIKETARREYPEFPEIKGRVSLQQDGRIGRFGWKAQVPTLREFVVTACAVELGLEAPGQSQGSDPTDLDSRPHGLDLTAEECEDLAAYVRSLPAPKPHLPAGEAGANLIRAGKEVFLSIGCGTCHTPDLGQVYGIYSDLLLHDMGQDTSDTGSYRMFRPESTTPDPPRPGPSAGQDRRKGQPEPTGATPQEWRTPPLWGLRDSGPYLHDGRAETIEQAIALHGAQGKNPAVRYFGLSPRRRQQVQAFLKSLVAPVTSNSSPRPS